MRPRATAGCPAAWASCTSADAWVSLCLQSPLSEISFSSAMTERQVFDMDVLKREVKVRGEVKDLTALEFNILEHLYSHKGKWCSNTSIIKSAWDTDVIEADMEVLHKHISNLRKKIEPDPSNHRLVLNKKGFGYMFQD